MTKTYSNPKEAVKKATLSAKSFLARHEKDPHAQAALSDFTTQPRASFHQRRLKVLLEELQYASDSQRHALRVLDLGCGAGLLTCAAASLGHRALGLDTHASQIHLANLFVREEKQSAVFWQADLTEGKGWQDTAAETLGGKPHAVLLVDALQHFPKPELLLASLAGWLDPGAMVLISEQNPHALTSRLRRRMAGWFKKAQKPSGSRSYGEWKKMLESLGLQVEAPAGVDLVPGLAAALPLQSWSLVFKAYKR